MNRKELNLAIFEGTADQVLWQPRLHEWIGANRARHRLPERFAELSDIEIYDELRCSPRYLAGDGIDESWNDVEHYSETTANHTTEVFRSPAGELKTVYEDCYEDGIRTNHRIVEFAVKTPDDFALLADIIDRKRFKPNHDAFSVCAKKVDHRAEPTMFLTSSGFTELIKYWCGLVETFYMITDAPDEMDVCLEAFDRMDDRKIDAALELPCKLFNFGDHATNEFTPPPILEKYMIPRWQRLTKRLNDNGRYAHSHWDGNSKLILPYVKQTGLHAIEALTPEPMGDISLEEVKDAVGDHTVCLDLIPAIFFLENYPMDDLLAYTRRVIDMFAPRLILGVSDEISSIGQIERIEAISNLVDEVCGLAD